MERACNTELHRENMKAFDYALSLCRDARPAVWAAWGAIIEKRAYLADCLRDMLDVGMRHGAAWYCAGQRSRQGHPHHPLYLRKDSQLEPFDVSEYLAHAL